MTSSGTVFSCCVMWPSVHFWWLYLESFVKPCDRVTDATAQQRKSGKRLLRQDHPLPAITHRCPCGHCLRHSSAHSASISGRGIFQLPAACAYFTSQIHTLSKRGEECLALLRWLSGRSTTPFSGNSIGVLEQLFQFLIQALEMEDQVTFLSSHQC